MKIEFPSKDDFHLIPKTFCGLESYLIIPKIDAKWSKDNLHFRSVIVDLEGEVLSCGFKKFFNCNEKPDCYPNPEEYEDWYIEEKKDGSLLIADFVNNQFSMRTRGTVSYQEQENRSDFELLLKQYPKLLEQFPTFSNLSLLFEIVTPNNVIVIRPQEVQFYLLGAINKDTLEMISSSELLDLWRKIGCPLVPQQYVFGNLKDLSQIVNLIKDWKGKEGIVLTYNKGQNKIKIKSDWYCFAHRVKSYLNSENHLIEYYLQCEMPNPEDFFKKIEIEFDFEIAQQLSPLINQICEAGEKSKKCIKILEEVVHDLRNLSTRKEIAEAISRNYKSHSALAFCLLDRKTITFKQYTDLIKENLEN